MIIDEISETINLMTEIPIESFDVLEQCYIIAAMTEFTKKIKPLYVKKAAENPQSTTFLFKL